MNNATNNKVKNISPNNLAKKNYINNQLNSYFNLFVVIFVAFLLLISYFLILKPKVDETTNAISENISSHERLLQAEKNKLASLQSAIIAYQKIDPVDLSRVNGILPDEYDKELLYGELAEIIESHGFIPVSIELTKDGEATSSAEINNNVSTGAASSTLPKKVGVINISLEIATIDYAGLKNLLNVLESNLRLLDIKDLSLGGGSAQLELATYYYKR